jgi:hypothetical protein
MQAEHVQKILKGCVVGAAAAVLALGPAVAPEPVSMRLAPRMAPSEGRLAGLNHLQPSCLSVGLTSTPHSQGCSGFGVQPQQA